jgi:hypothetical protein
VDFVEVGRLVEVLLLVELPCPAEGLCLVELSCLVEIPCQAEGLCLVELSSLVEIPEGFFGLEVLSGFSGETSPVTS